MKLKAIAFTLLLFSIVSCKNSNKNFNNDETSIEETKTDINTTQNKSGIEPEPENTIFDWSKTRNLKETLIADLQQNTTSQDVLIVKFLEDYNNLKQEFNGELSVANGFS